MKYFYPAIFSLEQGTQDTYNISFPDLPGCLTFGTGMEQAVEMATDVLNLYLMDKEDEKEQIPEASKPNEVSTDSPNDFVSMISCDTEAYRKELNQSVKKTLTIPKWLNQEAESAKINFSQTLQEALKEKLAL